MIDADFLHGSSKSVEVVPNLPAEKQLADSELRLADLTKQQDWEKLTKREQARQIREAKADVAKDKKTLSQAQSAKAKLERMRKRGLA